MLIVDCSQYVDMIRIANGLKRLGISNPMMTSSYIAEEVCVFYMSDLMKGKGDGFVIIPDLRIAEAVYRASTRGFLGELNWRRCNASVPKEAFDLGDLRLVLYHMDAHNRKLTARPANAIPAGLIAVTHEDMR